MAIGLIPLDERPVNVRYPAMIAEIAGVSLRQPPVGILSKARTPADHAALDQWLIETASELDYLIVSIEMLGYGGLIASRTTDDKAVTVINRLESLRLVKQRYPDLKIYGFDLIQRISYSNYNFEEAPYWSEYGTRFHRYSQLLDRQLQGQDVSEELESLRAQLPDEHIEDYLTRRLRNHIVNLNVLEMFKDNVFDLLVISSDDTAEYSIGTREKRWVSEWVDRTLADPERLLMYPGADEVGAALFIRAVNQQHGFTPKFVLDYAIEGDETVIAPFEDGPVSLTLERQIRAVGGELVTDAGAADLVVAVNTPSRIRTPFFDPQYAASEREQRLPHIEQFVERVKGYVEAGKQVIVADVAYPNGADPVLVDLLREQVDLTSLAAYGAWNTAGNTIGVALAHGIAALDAEKSPAQQRAQQRFLLHRFVEDWGYQHHVREGVGDRLEQETGERSIPPEQLDAVKANMEAGLITRLGELPGFVDKWRIANGSTRLPWERLFEVDFDLEQTQ